MALSCRSRKSSTLGRKGSSVHVVESGNDVLTLQARESSRIVKDGWDGWGKIVVLLEGFELLAR